jgi:hypothetical protein
VSSAGGGSSRAPLSSLRAEDVVKTHGIGGKAKKAPQAPVEGDRRSGWECRSRRIPRFEETLPSGLSVRRFRPHRITRPHSAFRLRCSRSR